MSNLLALTTGGAIIDLVALVIIALCVLLGVMRGFTKTFISVFGTILSLLFAVLLSSAVVNFAQNKFGMVGSISKGVSGVLSQIFGEEFMNTTLADFQSGSVSGIAAWLTGIILSIINNGSISLDHTLSQVVSPIFAYYISVAIVVVVLFIIFKIMFFILGDLVKKAWKFTPVKAVDKSLGAVLGVVQGAVTIQFIIIIFRIIPLGFCQTVTAEISNSVITSFICSISIFDKIIGSFSLSSIIEFIKNIVH